MDVKFVEKPCACLDTVVREVRNQELTQEIRLPEGMPDVGSILWCAGQCLLRGKEWDRGSVRLSGGLMLWVMYLPEDGSGPKCVEGWVPFQMNWDLPENTPEGTLRIRMQLRSADARSISARKILVRAGVGAMAEAFVPVEQEIPCPGEESAGAELLKRRYPMCLGTEAGEKTFSLEETLQLPESGELPEKLLCYRLEPVVLEKKVIGSRLAFRGEGRLHLLYQREDGKIRSWDFALPFSQVVQLDGEHSPDAQGDMTLCVTGLELDWEEDGLGLKAGLVAQYRICDTVMVELCQDAYCPGRQVQLQEGMLTLPAILDRKRETLYGQQTLEAQILEVVDVYFLPEFPRLRREEETVRIGLPGMVQVLYYDSEGKLQAGNLRWEGSCTVPGAESVALWAAAGPEEALRVQTGPGQLQCKWEVPVEITAYSREGIPMVTGITLGEPVAPDPMRPTLLLRRAEGKGLWDMAKAAGTTAAAIRRANGLTEDPEPNRMLLIPIP